jgi:serine/threonine protein kinase
MWALGVTIYRMISGREPFMQEYVIDTIEKIQTLDYTFGPEWGDYSKFLKDLVARLLKEKSIRLTAEEALKHPWFLQDRSPCSSPSKLSPNHYCSRFSVMPPTNSLTDTIYSRLLSHRNQKIVPVLQSIE